MSIGNMATGVALGGSGV